MLVNPNELSTFAYDDNTILNPRGQDFDVAELKDSIEQHGQLQPVSVWESGNDLFIIEGHRRTRACAELGRQVWVEKVEDGRFSHPLMAMLATNCVRDELPVAIVNNGTIVGGIARAVYVLHNDHGFSFSDIAKAVGQTPTTVSAMNNLFYSCDLAVNLVASGEMGITTFQRIAQYATYDQEFILGKTPSYSSRDVFETKRRFDNGFWNEHNENVEQDFIESITSASDDNVADVEDDSRDKAQRILNAVTRMQQEGRELDIQVKRLLLQSVVIIQNMIQQ